MGVGRIDGERKKVAWGIKGGEGHRGRVGVGRSEGEMLATQEEVGIGCRP